MFKRLILTALVLGVSVVLFSDVNSDTLPEKYVKKVIIDAKWGNGPGEFGMVPYPKSDPPIGPKDFYVNGNKIYVLDYVNERVEIFNSKGVFLTQIRYNKKEISDSLAGFVDITVDGECYVYLLGFLDYPSRAGIIAVFKNNGRYLGKIKLPIRLFASLFEEEGIKNGYFAQICEGANEFSVKDGRLLLRFGDRVYSLVNTHLLQSKGKRFSLMTSSMKPPLNFYTSTEKIILKKVKSKEKWSHLVSRDKNGEFFIRKSVNEVLKYTHKGKLLARITISISQPEYEMGKDLFISDEGVVYYWTNNRDGLKIIKLSKEGE